MRSSTSDPDFDEIAGDSSNSERLHFTKVSTYQTTTVTYDQQVYIKKYDDINVTIDLFTVPGPILD